MGYYRGQSDSCDSGWVISPEMTPEQASDSGVAAVLRRRS